MENFVGIITGCNSLTGIGRATAYSISKKNPKAIYVTDIKDSDLATLAEEITKTTGVECIAKLVDASSDEDVKGVIDDAIKKYDRLDFYFANAGIGNAKSMAEQTKEVFLETMTINAWSVFAAVKYASAAMEHTSSQKPKSAGSIVATASIAAARSGAGSMSYAASKAAIVNICQTGAWRLHGKNIRVNAVCPGVIETEMTKPLLEAVTEDPRKQRLAMLHSALERYGRPEEVGAMVAFLVSRDASFITGQAIAVDGGSTAALPYLPCFADS
ncbi:hypothetical protein EDC94DRAFT_697132 [Helicostylum pulchrum]|uniref:Uncharacterized protein n=1 Tax=Helicostylum pulchrum TaxID=562976 RepID=A0ABP9XMD9_9FUNG|nr:hypothetical protein EDC94DRAFT_697132 [Helicostylum pulchrum]